MSRFDDKIHKAVNVFLHRLSESPERLLKHVHLYVILRSIHYAVSGSRNVFRLESFAASLSLSVAYGANVESESDKLLSASENAMAAVDIAMVPGTFLVDTFPIRMNSGR